jgi:hypothetical protein
MIRVEGIDPGVLSRRMRHHAERLRPLIDALTYSLMYETNFARDDEVHVLRQSRTGPGSFSFVTADGDEYHFRMGADGNSIAVYDAYRLGQEIARLRTDAEARHFMRRIDRARARQQAVAASHP